MGRSDRVNLCVLWHGAGSASEREKRERLPAPAPLVMALLVVGGQYIEVVHCRAIITSTKYVPGAFALLNIYSTNYPVIVQYLFISAVFVFFNMLIKNNVLIFNLIFLFAYLNVHSSFRLLVRVSMVP